MIQILRADITTLDVDAIGNAANDRLIPGGGVCGAIHRAAGPELAEACRRLGGCPTGEARLTPGFLLRARFVIHAVGPVWQGGAARERELLGSAYDSAFRVGREESSIRSLAFPAISTGVYGFPKEEAARVALASMSAHQQDFLRIVACLFDEESVAIYRGIMNREW